MKAEAEAKATSARKAGWSIRVVKVGIPVYGKADYSKPGKPQRRPLTKEGYLLYERKTKTMKSSIIGKKCISSDIGRRSGDRWWRMEKKIKQFIHHPVGNWIVDMDANGIIIRKKGSWRMNYRLWKPVFFMKHGSAYPKGVPKYVREEIREMKKRIIGL